MVVPIVNNLVDVHAEDILTPSDNRTRGNAAYRTLYKCWCISIFFLPAYHLITWNTIPPTLRQVNAIAHSRVRMSSAWTSTKLLTILYMNVALALALRCSSDSHCNLEIINNIHQLEAIQRRAARFVYNNFYDREPGVVTSMISRLQWESLEWRAKARTSFGQECILRLRKPMVRLAFADMLLMWLVQLKSELNVTPRYLLSLVRHIQ
jgi:hypothetical protein